MVARLSAAIQALYAEPLAATRTGPLFGAHSYPTKISPEAVGLLIATHTRPGALILDGFGGSGTTAIGALLSSQPTKQMREVAARLGLKPRWGARRAVVYELSGLGSFIGRVMCSRPNPREFASAASRVLEAAQSKLGWMYVTQDDRGTQGVARYYIWSEILECESCGSRVRLWDACVRLKPALIADKWRCSACGRSYSLANSKRVSIATEDRVLGAVHSMRQRELCRVDGSTGTRRWRRDPSKYDAILSARIANEPIPNSVPIEPMLGRGGLGWGDLWRAGYHEGMSHVHHFYTERNLIALGTLHDLVANEPPRLQDALKLWISSYNSSHSTLMTRVVAKKNTDDLVLTSAQPGVLYVSGLPVEKNVFLGLKKKIPTFSQAFSILCQTTGAVEIVNRSSTRLDLADASVDYVFTDPPFGANIPYSEVNFIAESWLKNPTKIKDEAVISPAQHKGLSEYQGLLTKTFSELRRVLKPTGKLTLVFHSTQATVWKALSDAYIAAGLQVVHSSILDKRQGSFKQVTTKNAVRGDPMLLLARGKGISSRSPSDANLVIRKLLQTAKRRKDPMERSPQRIYSRFVSHYINQHDSPPINAEDFYVRLAAVSELE